MSAFGRIAAKLRWAEAPECASQLGPCLEWSGSLNTSGYPSFKLARRTRLVARWLWERTYGPLEALELDHLCRNPRCLRFSHLEPVTHLENVRRGRAGWNSRAKTHCPRGHSFDPANTHVYLGRRVCRACKREKQRERRLAMGSRQPVP